MNRSQAQAICMEVDYQTQKQKKWNEIFANEEEIIDALEKVYVPKDMTAPDYTFKGYTYIYSFAKRIQNGIELTEKQMTQCKRLAREIKKAAAIADYRF